MVGEPCKLVFQNPFSQGKHKEVDGIIDCSNQCVIYDYSNLYNAYIDTCGDRKCEQQVEDYFQNSTDGLTYFERSKLEYPFNTLPFDGMCHCGSESCFNTQDSFDYFNIPILDSTRGPDENQIIDLYPNFNCKEFNKLREFKAKEGPGDKSDHHHGERKYENPCAMFNLQNKTNRNLERDEFKFYFPNYYTNVNILYPNQSDDDAYDGFEEEKMAKRPIRMSAPLTSPTNCHCGLENFIYSKKYSDGLADFIANFCDGNYLGEMCQMLLKGQGYGQMYDRLESHVTEIGEGLTDENIVTGTIDVGYNVVGGILDGANILANIGLDVVRWLVPGGENTTIDTHLFMENRFGYGYWNNIQDLIESTHEIGDELTFTGNIQRKIPLHMDQLSYMKDNYDIAPYQLRDWNTLGYDGCSAHSSLFDYCFQDVADENVFFDFLANPTETFFDWLFGQSEFEIDAIRMEGVMEFYHESTPYRPGKTSKGTIGVDYDTDENYKRIGPYSEIGNPILPIVSTNDLNTVNLTETTPYYSSTLGAYDIGERFKIADYPYNRALLSRALKSNDILYGGGLSETFVDNLGLSVDWYDTFLQNIFVVGGFLGPLYGETEPNNVNSMMITDGFGGDCDPGDNYYANQCMSLASSACDCSNIWSGDWQVYLHTQCGERYDKHWHWPAGGYWWRCKCRCPDGHVSGEIEHVNTYYNCNESCRIYCANGHMEGQFEDECFQAPNNCGYHYLTGEVRSCSSLDSQDCNDYRNTGPGCSGCNYVDPDDIYQEECWTGPTIDTDDDGEPDIDVCIHEGAANYNPMGNMGGDGCQFFNEYPFDLYTTSIEAFKRMDVRIELDSESSEATVTLQQKKSSFKWGATVRGEMPVYEWTNEYHNTDENFDDVQNEWPSEVLHSTWLDYFGENTSDDNIYFNSMTNNHMDKFENSFLQSYPSGVFADGDVIFYNNWRGDGIPHMTLNESLENGTCINLRPAEEGTIYEGLMVGGTCLGGGNNGMSCREKWVNGTENGSIAPADDMCVPLSGKVRKLFHYNQEQSDINYGGIFFNGVKITGLPDIDEFKAQCLDFEGDLPPLWLNDDYIRDNLISTLYTQERICELCNKENNYCGTIDGDGIDGNYTLDNFNVELNIGNGSFICSVEDLCTLPGVGDTQPLYYDFYNDMQHTKAIREYSKISHYRYHALMWDKNKQMLEAYFPNMNDFEAFVMLLRYVHDNIFLTGEYVKEYDLLNEHLPGRYGGWQGLSNRFDNVVSAILDSDNNDINDASQLADAINTHRFFGYGSQGIGAEPEPELDDEINYIYGCMDDSSGINTDIYGDGLYQACNYNPNATMEGQSWNFKCHYAYNYPSRTCYYDADKNGSYETPIQVSMCPDMDCKTYSSFYPEFDYRDVDDDLGIVNGCTDSMACNWNPIATEDDGSCDFGVDGYDNQGYHCGDLNVIKEFVRQNTNLGNARDYGTWVEVPGIVRTSTDRTDTQPIRRRLRLTELNLDNKTLIGVIPTIIGQAKRLNYLNLGRNGDEFGGNLTGPIPRSIGELRELTFLGLHGNHLTGEIPVEIGNLINLEELDLQGNPKGDDVDIPGLLQGEVPSSINNLRKLTRIELQRNQLGGSFPIIRNLTQLDFLQIADNNFSNIDGAFFARNITNIYAKNNNIMELNAIPSGFERMSLQKLNLAQNSLRSLPEEFGNLTSLVELILYSNRFSSIPRFISKLINLEVLQLSDNKIKTLSANVLSNLNNLQALYLDSNDITSISENFCEIRERNLPLLNILRLGNNELCDKYYSGRGTDTQYFCISRNEFNMPFPQDQSNCCPGPNGEINYIECDETAVPLDYISEVTDTPRNEEYLIDGYVPEFKFDASHFQNKKFFTLMLKIVVDISDYYRVNHWGGEPHRFYLNEFHVINDMFLDTKFPTGDNQIGNDMISYADLLDGLKPNSTRTGPRYENLPTHAWYYYDRLGIGVQGHLWTNEMLKGGGFYNSGIPSENRSSFIFDRFGSHMWKVLEKLATASDRRLPIKITELDWFTENYCKRFENVGSIIEGVCGEPEPNNLRYCKQGKLYEGVYEPGDIGYTEDLDGTPKPKLCTNHTQCDDTSTYYPSNFDENHPDYKFCKEMGEFDANGGKGRRMFDLPEDDLGDITPFTWSDLNVDEAKHDVCDNHNYRKSDINKEVIDQELADFGYSEEGYCGDDGACVGGPFAGSTYNGESCIVAGANQHGFCNRRVEYENSPEYEYLLNSETYTGNWKTLQKIRTEQMLNLYTKLYSHPQIIGVTNWGGIGHTTFTGNGNTSDFCEESVFKRYVKDYGLTENKLVSGVFQGLMLHKNPAITGGTFIKEDSGDLVPAEYMKNGHKEFIKQFDWVGEVSETKTSENFNEFFFSVPFGEYEVYVNGDLKGTINVPIEVSGVFNTDVWTHTSPWQGSDYNIENYIKVENMSDNMFELTDVKTILTNETPASPRRVYFASGQENNKGTTIYLNINDAETRKES